MLFGETFRVALEALGVNKLRSFLTMLGIVIGVAAVITMVALGRGAQQSVRDRIAALGTTLLEVMPGQARFPGGVASPSDRAGLTFDDVAALEARGTHLAAVQPELSASLQVQRGDRNTNTTVTGTTANALDVQKLSIASGRMFTRGEDAGRRRVAVLGPQVVTDLGTTAAAVVGADVRIAGTPFTVVGVLASKGQAMGPNDPDDVVLVPVQTARVRIVGGERLRSVNVLASSEHDIPAAMAEIKRILRREHRLRAGVADDFHIRNQADFLSTLSSTTQVFNGLLAGIAAVSLLVGGIGIMNIMLVSVTERTREIGVRMALGATRANILLQFLIEALVLCLMGGAVGVTLGAGASLVLKGALHWNASVGASSVAIAFLFAAAVGVAFGVWPARRAASLAPVEALRYE